MILYLSFGVRKLLVDASEWLNFKDIDAYLLSSFIQSINHIGNRRIFESFPIEQIKTMEKFFKIFEVEI